MCYQMWHFDSEWTPVVVPAHLSTNPDTYTVPFNGHAQTLGALYSTWWDQIPPYWPICWQICCKTSLGTAAGQEFCCLVFWIHNSVSHVHVNLNMYTVCCTSDIYVYTVCTLYILRFKRTHLEPAAHCSNVHIYIPTVHFFSHAVVNRAVIGLHSLVSHLWPVSYPENHTHIATTLGTPAPHEIIKGLLGSLFCITPYQHTHVLILSYTQLHQCSGNDSVPLCSLSYNP